MDRPGHRGQFSLRAMLISMTAIALLILPTQSALHWILNNLNPRTVSVPDGGTVIIGSMVFRWDATRPFPIPTQNQSQNVNDKTDSGTSSKGADTKSLVVTVSPQVIIQEADAELDTSPNADGLGTRKE